VGAKQEGKRTNETRQRREEGAREPAGAPEEPAGEEDGGQRRPQNDIGERWRREKEEKRIEEGSRRQQKRRKYILPSKMTRSERTKGKHGGNQRATWTAGAAGGSTGWSLLLGKMKKIKELKKKTRKNQGEKRGEEA